MSKEETFGPFVTITVVDDADQAVSVANQTTYGLSAGILTRDADRGLALAERIAAGIVRINDQPVNDEPQVRSAASRTAATAASAASRRCTSSSRCAR